MIRFICPNCNSNYFGSIINKDNSLTRHCHGHHCRFTWQEKDDHKYFFEVINLKIYKNVEHEIEELKQKYNELLYAVGNKYPNESRHQTAFKYIRQAETISYSTAKEKKEN